MAPDPSEFADSDSKSQNEHHREDGRRRDDRQQRLRDRTAYRHGGRLATIRGSGVECTLLEHNAK
jgi:hypothetical protein